MACNVVIIDVKGLGTPLNAIKITGFAEECKADPFKNIVSVKVGISCVSKDGPFQEIIVEVDDNGEWVAIFQNLGRCACDSEIFVTAVCNNDENCIADPISKIIKCIKCPSVTFGSASDDVAQPQIIQCDTDGTVLVFIHFNVFNPSSVDIAVSVNCGLGGTSVAGGTFIVPQGGSLFVDSVICRYDPSITPVPSPFIEFFDVADNTPLDCLPVPIQIGTLPDCEDVCPNMVVIEVKDSDGNIIDPEGVQCLPSDEYTISVIIPANVPGMTYTFSINGVVEQFGINPDFIVQVDSNVEIEVTVSVFSSIDCPNPSNAVILKGCADNCDQELIINVRNTLGQVIDPNECLDPGTYTIQVTSPNGSNWSFAWVINGVQDNTTNAAEYIINLNSGDNITISVTAEASGCQDKIKEIALNSCGNNGDGNGGGGIFSCNGLLIAAITLLISGSILIITGTCTGVVPLTVAGGITVAIGFILLGLWAWLCKKFTSCSVLNKLRCLLNWLALIAAIIGAIGVGSGSVACGLTAIATGGSWALIAQFLTDVMVKKNCEITSCFIP